MLSHQESSTIYKNVSDYMLHTCGSMKDKNQAFF